jgi:DNA polymerase-1
MNVGSGAQVQQLLFAGVPNRDADKKDPLPLERVFKVGLGCWAASWRLMPVRKSPLTTHTTACVLSPPAQVPNTMGLMGEKDKKPKKSWDIRLHSVWGPAARSPLQPEVFTPAGVPACSTPVLKALAGKAGRARKKLAELGMEELGEGRWRGGGGGQ